MYVIWLFCIFPSTSFLPSFNNSFPCPLIELPAALVCILCLSWSLFITLLHSSHAFTSVLERYVQTFFFFCPCLFVIFFLCNTSQLFASSGSWLSSTLRIHSHLGRLSFLFILSISVFPLPLSVFGCSDFLIFVSVYFYLLCADMLLRSISVDSWKRNRGS